MYDLFFISFKESNADKSWQKFKHRYPHAKRKHGIVGIENAHMSCAKDSFTKMFWTVDADCIPYEWWSFDYIPPEYDQLYLHIWYSKNIVNNLTYGYGSIKLWPRDAILNFKKSWIDFTTQVGNIKLIKKTISETHFNSSPYDTWRSAFRESVKLLNNIKNNPLDTDSQERLHGWTTIANQVPYAEWALLGSNDAREWFDKNLSELTVINDFNHLEKMFLIKYLKGEKNL